MAKVLSYGAMYQKLNHIYAKLNVIQVLNTIIITIFTTYRGVYNFGLTPAPPTPHPPVSDP